MLWTFNTDQRIKECELRDNPIIIRVNKFDEASAQFCGRRTFKRSTVRTFCCAKLEHALLSNYRGISWKDPFPAR